MRPNLHARLRNREPEPGLLNLPLPLPSVPVLSPILTPLVAGAQPPKPTQNKPPSSPPASTAAASSPPPASQGPANPPSGGSSGGSNGGSNNGGSNGGSHSGGGNPPSSGGSSGGSGSNGSNSGGNSGGGNPPSQGGNPDNHGDGNNAPSAGGSSSQQNSGSNSSPPGSTASTPPAAIPPDAPISVVEGSTFLVTPTGMVPIPVNNAAANAASDPSNSDSTHSGTGSLSVSENSPSATHAGAISGSQPASGSSHAAGGSNSAGSGSIVGGGGDDGGSTSAGGNTGASAGSHSHISGGAIGGIVTSLLIVCLGIALVLLRKRHKRRKDERRVEWVSGYVSNGSAPDMQQRRDRESKRSSWGTPVEYRISDAFRRSMASSPSDDQEHNYIVSPPSPYYDYERSSSGAPVLPMPVHSPTQMRAQSPEDPFADGLPQPLRPLSSLPLRLSILSSASGHEDPFHDYHAAETRPSVEELSPPGSAASNKTFGRSAVFPLPPPTPGSRDTLLTPGIMISFPDSPISPSFAAAGTSSYPRRATVQSTFTPATARRDEVRVEQGDSVSVVSVYEDGWAFVQRERDNERGLVPLTHLAM